MKTQKRILGLLHERSEQAVQELQAAYGPLCHSIAKNILTSAEDVEEVVNDTMLTVWNTIPPHRPISLPAYINRVARNHALMKLRSNHADMRDDRIKICLSELELCLPSRETPETALEAKQITETINAYLATLTKINRVIFVRRYYCHESTKDIADLTGLSDQAIRSRLLRMRAELRERLEKEGIPV